MSEGKYNITIVYDNGEKEQLFGVDDIDYKKEYLAVYVRSGRVVYMNWDKIVKYTVDDLRTSEERYKDNKEGT